MYRLVLTMLTIACLAACQKTPPKGVTAVDAKLQWASCGDVSAVRAIRADPGNQNRLILDLSLGPSHRKAMVCLDLAQVPQFKGGAPIALVGDYQVTLTVDDRFPGSYSATSGASLYYKAPDWSWHESGWQHIPNAGDHRLTLSGGASDVVEIGFYLALNDMAGQTYNGTVTVSIDRLWLKPTKPKPSAKPSEGSVRLRLEEAEHWASALGSPSGAGTRRHPDGLAFRCDLSSGDPNRRTAVAIARLGRVPGLSPSPLDMSQSGFFVEARVPQEFISRTKFASGFHAGLVDSSGNIFWGPWQRFEAADAWVAAYLAPETRYPLPLAFRPMSFDPRGVVAAAVRFTVDQVSDVRFDGEVLFRNARISHLPPEVLAERQRVADAIGTYSRTREAAPAAGAVEPVPIDVFLANSGVNLPWPWETYPAVGSRTWAPGQGGITGNVRQLRDDFRYLVSKSVRQVRIFLVTDCRTGFLERDGRIELDPIVLKDVDTLLGILGEFPPLRLIATVLDFSIAAGIGRERLGLVGEYPEWIAERRLRAQFLTALA